MRRSILGAAALLGLGLACGGAMAPTPATSANCEAACAKWSDCGLEDLDQCRSECPQIPDETLELFASSTCADLKAMSAGTYGGGSSFGDGSRCLQDGTQDCPFLTICCANGDSTTVGQPGMCLDPAVCMMPVK